MCLVDVDFVTVEDIDPESLSVQGEKKLAYFALDLQCRNEVPRWPIRAEFADLIWMVRVEVVEGKSVLWSKEAPKQRRTDAHSFEPQAEDCKGALADFVPRRIRLLEDSDRRRVARSYSRV